MTRLTYALTLCFTALSVFACSEASEPSTQGPDSNSLSELGPSEGATPSSDVASDSEVESSEALEAENPQMDDEGIDPDGPDYSELEYWLCHPDRGDGPCFDNLDVTQINPDASLEIIPHQKRDAPAFDCFYVYPTCSLDSAGNSDLIAGEEPAIAHIQAARFQSMCRVFAPIYRQVTLEGLFIRQNAADESKAYGDVEAAFDHYMENYNEGRGVVLIGHSQGTRVLTRLVQERFDAAPALRSQLISAYLIGLTVEVPEGELVGGSFQHIPLCSSADQSGCVVTYATYRALEPPQVGSLFGLSSTPGMEAGCTDPAALLADEGPLESIFPQEVPAADADLISGTISPFADPSSAPDIETDFYSVPGLVSGSCVRQGDYHYLSIEVHADPDDPRADDVGGDLILPGWGLHLVDVNLALGQLERLVSLQAESYLTR